MRTKKIFLFLLFIGNVVNASFLESLQFDEVRSRGGFNCPAMQNVSSISPSINPLNLTEKEELLNSGTLFRLHTLDLSGQNVDDAFVDNLSKNPCFARIINIDLSDNPDITPQALEYILNSEYLGSVRDLPQVSGRYGCPATTIFVRARNTGIKDRNINPLFGFHISYRHPFTGQETSPSTDEAVKFLDVTL